jgi:hypothetical protein
MDDLPNDSQQSASELRVRCASSHDVEFDT